ncbi:hypothetical protein H6G00_20155 [Leptolyngbya sp. FACHB-541]|nr:hypothetical protein [Leptolyngbya sp. FACHB-541]MBD1998906.1 hypothetical protein [Leptolyngbya sp. FACHB-541]
MQRFQHGDSLKTATPKYLKLWMGRSPKHSAFIPLLIQTLSTNLPGT